MGNTLPKLHQGNGIAYTNGPNTIHGGTITLSNVLPQCERMVPPPHEQPGLIQKVHLELGHFGVKCTFSVVAPHYHWRGMYAQV
jgi:hypothetical protein